jgi:glutamate decarboxylase
MGANAQVALEYVLFPCMKDSTNYVRKFARYFDVECRLVPVKKETNYCLDVQNIHKYLDENTIGT